MELGAEIKQLAKELDELAYEASFFVTDKKKKIVTIRKELSRIVRECGLIRKKVLNDQKKVTVTIDGVARVIADESGLTPMDTIRHGYQWPDPIPHTSKK